MPHLAFYTFGILHDPLAGPRTQHFASLVPDAFTSAAETPGFVTRRINDGAQQRFPRFFRAEEHALVAHTLSLWESLESVYAFAYRGRHGAALRQRKEWFLSPEWPTYVSWWVEDNALPDWYEAYDRLEHLHDHGATPFAFDFKRPFDTRGLPVKIDRERVNAVIPRVQ